MILKFCLYVCWSLCLEAGAWFWGKKLFTENKLFIQKSAKTCGLVSCTIEPQLLLIVFMFSRLCRWCWRQRTFLCVTRFDCFPRLFFILFTMKERNEELIWFACMAKNPFEGQFLRNVRSLTFLSLPIVGSTNFKNSSQFSS